MSDVSAKSNSVIATIIIGLSGILTLAMGASAAIDPVATLSFLSAGDLGPDMRNEVRAYYGGLNIGLGLVLLYSLRRTAEAKGVLITVIVAFAGTATLRILSFAIEMPASDWPLIFFGLESATAALLYLALRLDQG